MLTPQPKDKLLSPYKNTKREKIKIDAKAQPKEKQNKV